jgi:enediyne biosynthesis protein E4
MAMKLSRPPSTVPRLSRRQFLSGAAGCAAFSAFSQLARALPDPVYPFRVVPPSVSNITWVHSSGKSAERYLPETDGSGCAFLDYDDDGWMDIYLVNGGRSDFFVPPHPLRNALYRNNRDGTFTDVTEKAGVAGGGFGMGAAVGDYNGDGFPDIYLTQYGRSILYRNNGDGTFTDVTEQAGVAAPGWASSAVWFDYDNDGRLDLFVCRFGDFDKSKHQRCMAPNLPGIAGSTEYCNPRVYKPRPSWLFHNNGDGTFTDVSQQTAIVDNPGRAWGVVATDINNDGWMDLFVANDQLANFLYVNREGKHFDEIGFTSGVAYGDAGATRSGMGVDSSDLFQDGWMDLSVTNMNHELYGLYRNKHDETFEDMARATGFAQATEMRSGWGLKFFDYDNDGNMDLFIANGHPDDLIDTIFPAATYREPLMLFHNSGTELKQVSKDSGPVFAMPMASRGLALGDFDNDGAVDVLISNNDEAPVLLHNEVGSRNNWLGLRLVGQKSNPDAIGARIVYQSGDLRRSRMKVGGGSYLSSHDPRVVLGIGTRPKIDWIEVKWPRPSNATERFMDIPINRYITIVEGQGKWK